MGGFLHSPVVDPSQNDAAHAVPEREREHHEEQRLRYVGTTKPPVDKAKHGDEAGAREKAEPQAVAKAHIACNAVPPSGGIVKAGLGFFLVLFIKGERRAAPSDSRIGRSGGCRPFPTYRKPCVPARRPRRASIRLGSPHRVHWPPSTARTSGEW